MIRTIFNHFAFTCFLLLAGKSFKAQNFTWMKGQNSVDQPGIYGQQGVGSVNNNPGGRSLSAKWQDASGNFWMFGGNGFDYIGNAGYLNDLWKYNPTSNQWTWISGDNVFLQLGKYGTQGVPSNTNCPGARSGATSWIDGGGNLWLFGGVGYASAPNIGYLNDLWKYNIANNEWTWVGGSNVTDAIADYGAILIPSASNQPGSRAGASTWKDVSGKIYMFGGNGVTTNSNTVGELNDLWTYDASVNEWLWVNGSNVQNQNGTYGTLGAPSSANAPGGRNQALTWLDNSGNIWMFGGNGFDSGSATSGMLNDLWKYNKSANQWTWINGSNASNQAGSYGTMGTPAPSNIPGSRSAGATWVDVIGNVWLFGGAGNGVTANSVGTLHDLWKYNISTNQFTWIKGGNGINLNGVYGTLNLPSGNNSPGGRSAPAYWLDASNNLWFFGGNGKGATGNFGQLSDLWTFKNCHLNPLVITVTPNDSVVCAGEPVILSAFGSNNYTWSNGTFSSSIVITPTANVTYTVYSSDNTGCVYNTVYTQTILACLGIKNVTNNSNVNIYPNPSSGILHINGLTNGDTLQIRNALGTLISETTKDVLYLETGLAEGIYFYSVVKGNKSKASGKLIISSQ